MSFSELQSVRARRGKVSEKDFNNIELKQTCNIIIDTFRENGCDEICIVLFGFNENRNMSFPGTPKLFVMYDGKIDIQNYIIICEKINILLKKSVARSPECSVYPAQEIIEIINSVESDQKDIGSYFDIILRLGKVIFDSHGIYDDVVSRIEHNEDKFMQNCIDFAKFIGSQKWEEYWSKRLSQFRFREGVKLF
jgi:hypothetical protein